MFFHVGVQRCDIYAESHHIIGIGCVAEEIKNFFSFPGRKVDLFFHECVPPYSIRGGRSSFGAGKPPLSFTLFSSASFYRTGWTIYCFFVDYTVWEQLVAINSASSGANCVLSSSGRKLLYSFERTISDLLIQQVAAGTGNSPPGNGLPSCGCF